MNSSNRPRPPRWARWLLTRLHPDDTLEEVEGDLDELYAYWHGRGPTGRAGQTQATFRYLLNVISVLPLFVRRRKCKQEYYHSPSILSPAMIRNYVKTAYRNLLKNRVYSVINSVGLSVGLTCSTLIALWVYDELSYDTFNQNYDRIFRVTTTKKTENGLSTFARTGALVANTLNDNYPEVEQTVRLRRREEVVLRGGKQTLESNIIFADPSFFNVFSYRLIRGNPATALVEPYSMILTESTARNYFGDKDPIGQTLTVFLYDSTGRGANYKITGIIPDPPRNAHFTFSMLGSFRTLEVFKPTILTTEGWNEQGFYTYLLLKKGVDHQAFAAKIAHLYAQHTGDRQTDYISNLQPLADIHLRSDLKEEIADTGTIDQIYIFSTIGLFILLLAGINYANLATARSVGRAKEVGIKKVVGALKSQLILSYLVESTLIALLALSLSSLVSWLVLPFFNQFTGKDLALTDSPLLLFFLIGITVFLGLLSGLYPAFVLSAFKPVSVLKGPFKSSTKGIVLRQSLVVTQFVITMLLISGIVVIYIQMSYIRHKDLGYDKEALLFLNVNGNADVVQRYEAFRAELAFDPLIGGVTASTSSILYGLDAVEARTIDRAGKPVRAMTSRFLVDANYLGVYGMKLLAGKNFKPQAPGDTSQSVIVNERALKQFGWQHAADAIGKPFRVYDQTGTIIGVVRNFHVNSLQHAIEPLAIFQRTAYFNRITVRIDQRQTSQTVALIERVWAKHFPNALFDYHFYDLALAERYRAEERFSTILSAFSALSLLIACLGLYGLISFATLQKTKEIGIRKIVGASVGEIVVLLLSDFLKPVVVAGLIAGPVAWYLMHGWLQNFAYRIDLSWWMFVGAGLLVLLIALLTVSFQSIKAALVNPVKSLRSE